MSSSLHFLVSRAKSGNASATVALLANFLPQIKNLSRVANGEDTYQDLQLFLLELTNKIPLERAVFQNDRILGAYIAHSLRRHSLSLKIKGLRREQKESALNEAAAIASPSQFENAAWLFALLKTLTPKERQLIYWIYFGGYTCAEISRARRVSIQAVNQAKQKILRKLRKACAERNSC